MSEGKINIRSPSSKNIDPYSLVTDSLRVKVRDADNVCLLWEAFAGYWAPFVEHEVSRKVLLFLMRIERQHDLLTHSPDVDRMQMAVSQMTSRVP